MARHASELLEAARAIAERYLGVDSPMVEELTRDIVSMVGDSYSPADDTFVLKSAPKRGKEVEIPPALDVPDFRAAWAEWLEHRRQKRKPLTSRSMKRQLDDLRGIGVEKAINCLHVSIRNDWAGIFPERYADGTATKTHRPGLAAPGTVHSSLEQDSRRRREGTL